MKSKFIENLKNNLRTFGNIGLISLIASCSSLSKEISFEEKYGKRLMMRKNGNYLLLSYDRDYDGKEDLKLIYQIVGANKSTAYFELIQRWDDKNRNGTFDSEEMINVKKSKEKIILEKDPVILKKEKINLKNLVNY